MRGCQPLKISFPDKPVTRSEFAVIITKFNGQLKALGAIKTNSFKDVFKSDINVRYIELQKANIPSYKSGTSLLFKPNNYITREDALAALVKIKGLDDNMGSDYGASGSEIDISEYVEDSNKINPALKGIISIGLNNDLIDLKNINGKDSVNPKINISRRQLANLLVNASNVSGYDTSEQEAINNDTPDNNSNDENVDTKTPLHLINENGKRIMNGSLLKLDNGETWEEIDYEYQFIGTENATVDLYQDNGIWIMIIDGVDKKIQVKKIK